MATDWDAAGFIASSKYRREVVEQLYDRGSAIPSDIAAATEYALPHVSRALGQLREQGLVELLVPEDRRRGRLYGLTRRGTAAFERLTRDGRGGEYEIVPVDQFDYPGLIEFLEAEVGDALRAVACIDDGVMEVTFLSGEVRDSYTGGRLGTLLAELDVLWRKVGSEDVQEALGDHRYMVHGFDNAVLLCLFLPERDLVVSADPTLDVPVSTLAEAALDQLKVA